MICTPEVALSLNRKNAVPKTLQRRHDRRVLHQAIKSGLLNPKPEQVLKVIEQTPGVVLLSDPEEE